MKISVIGVGRVGSTLAYTLSMRRFVRELVLVGRTRESTLGDALDLEHAQSFAVAPAKIIAGTVDDTAGSEVIALCASVPMPRDLDDRLSLGPRNVRLFNEIVPPLARLSPGAKFVVLTNPVDVITYYTIQFSGAGAKRVMGTGTLVDSARFRRLLSADVGIHPDDLRAYILGEHGESQFPAMSVALAGGERIEDNAARRALFDQTVKAGFEVFRLKGHTNFAIAAAAAAIVEAIALDEKHTMPLSTLIDGYHGVSDVCLSVPVVVGRGGVERVLHPELSREEVAAFQQSAAVVGKAVEAARPAR